MGPGLERTLPNDLGRLPGVAQEVRAYLRGAGVESSQSYAVDLALEELVVNTIRHGYEDRDEHQIRIQVELTEDEIRLTIEDDGRPFDPTCQPDPPRPASLAEAPIGGRGILMVRRMIEDIRYQRTQGRNRLVLVLPRKR